MAATVALLLIANIPVVADIVPGTSSIDAFDSTRGTFILDHDTQGDPLNAFRTSGGFEDGHTLMRNGGLGSVSFIDFETPCNPVVEGLRLFAHHDFTDTPRRALSAFSVFADTNLDGEFETLVVNRSVVIPYGNEPDNVAEDARFLDLTVMLENPVAAERWRLEVTQGSSVQPWEGARIVELDAIGSCQVAVDIRPNSCPNPLPLNPNGVLPVAILGTALFNVADVDPETVRLAGVAPRLGSAEIADVMTPYEGGFSEPANEEDCLGGLAEPQDGYDDLVLKFPLRDLRDALCPDVTRGDVVFLPLTAELVDGGTISGQDVVRIVGKCPA